MSTLHKKITQIIKHITFLETDTPEAAEGECRLWQQEGCTILLDFGDVQASDKLLAHIAQQLDQLDAQREVILADLAQHFLGDMDTVSPLYVAFFAEDETTVFCDFAVDCGNGQMAEYAWEDDGEWTFNGFSAI